MPRRRPSGAVEAAAVEAAAGRPVSLPPPIPTGRRVRGLIRDRGALSLVIPVLHSVADQAPPGCRPTARCNSRRISSPAATPRPDVTAICGALQPVSASSPWPGRQPRSAASSRSASSSESPAARTRSAPVRRATSAYGRALGERLGYGVDLAALQRDGPAALLAPSRRVPSPSLGQQCAVDDQVGEQILGDPLLEQPRPGRRSRPGARAPPPAGRIRRPAGALHLACQSGSDTPSTSRCPPLAQTAKRGGGPGQVDAVVLLAGAGGRRYEDGGRRRARCEQPGGVLASDRTAARLPYISTHSSRGASASGMARSRAAAE